MYPLPLCQRIKADGIRCAALAMKHERFCYFHIKDRRQKNRVRRAARIRLRSYLAGPTDAQCQAVALPKLDSATAIVKILNDIMAGLWTGQLHPDTAGRMLFAIELSQRTPRMRFPAPSTSQPSGFSPKVEAQGLSPVNQGQKEPGFSPGAEALNTSGLNAGMKPRSSTEGEEIFLSPEQGAEMLDIVARINSGELTPQEGLNASLAKLEEILK